MKLFIEPSFVFPLHKTMLLINGKYSRDYNRRKEKKGHFWMDRYKCIPVETDAYALGLLRYIHRMTSGILIIAKEFYRASGLEFRTSCKGKSRG